MRPFLEEVEVLAKRYCTITPRRAGASRSRAGTVKNPIWKQARQARGVMSSSSPARQKIDVVNPLHLATKSARVLSVLLILQWAV